MLQKTASDPRFPRLFTPAYIGKLWVKNRVIKAPTETRFADTEGYVTQRLISHYREIAKGGVGLVITEFAYVDGKESQTQECQMGADRDDMLPGLDWLATTIQDNGARACLQISHAGMANLMGRSAVRAPSPVPWPTHIPMPVPETAYATVKAALSIPLPSHIPGLVPQELTVSEIKKIIEAFGKAALRARKAGFDMVEVHGAHGYLITNFLSPHYNKRSDSYGGSLPNRMRLLLEVVDNVRRQVGKDFPVSVRLSAVDHLEEEPITIEETLEVARALEKAGVDCLHISSGGHQSLGRDEATMYSPLLSNVWAAEAVKKVVSIPVIAVRSITSPELAEKVLAEGKADFVALARPLLADPYFTVKARTGRPEDIRPCIRCSECFDRGVLVGSVKCSVNPTLGKEDELKVTPAVRKKRVAVVGSGPAGMEAARVAAMKGHRVFLFEKNELGGMLIPASVPAFKADIGTFMKYLSRQVNKAGVEIISEEATAQSIKHGTFDAVVVATGAIPLVPDVPGIDRPSVVSPLDVLFGAPTGNNVVVVGGGMVGSDVALFLAEQGKRVTITTRGDTIARGMSTRQRIAFLIRLSRRDVNISAGVHLHRVTESGIAVSDASGVGHEIEADSIVIAGGMVPNRRLFDELAQMPGLDEVYAVGDCIEPGTIFEAVHQGYTAGFNL